MVPVAALCSCRGNPCGKAPRDRRAAAPRGVSRPAIKPQMPPKAPEESGSTSPLRRPPVSGAGRVEGGGTCPTLTKAGPFSEPSFSPPPSDNTYLCLAVMDGVLCVIFVHGRSSPQTSPSATPCLMKSLSFEAQPKELEEQPLSPMHYARSGLGTAALNGRLVAAGGKR